MTDLMDSPSFSLTQLDEFSTYTAQILAGQINETDIVDPPPGYITWAVAGHVRGDANPPPLPPGMDIPSGFVTAAASKRSNPEIPDRETSIDSEQGFFKELALKHVELGQTAINAMMERAGAKDTRGGRGKRNGSNANHRRDSNRKDVRKWNRRYTDSYVPRGPSHSNESRDNDIPRRCRGHPYMPCPRDKSTNVAGKAARENQEEEAQSHRDRREVSAASTRDRSPFVHCLSPTPAASPREQEILDEGMALINGIVNNLMTTNLDDDENVAMTDDALQGT
jgi:hypothetical protein